MMGVSIIIPAYNAEKTIAECLAAIQNLDWDGTMEIILVNDGSTDNTAKIASTFPQVQVISTPNGGAARAMNIGVKAAHHAIVVSVDSDAILEKDWLKKIIPWFEFPTVAAVAGYVATGNKRLIGKLAGYYSELRQDRISTLYTDHLGGANTAYRRQALIQVGMFDEQEKKGDDVRISRRLRAAGYHLMLRKDAICKHYWKETAKSYFQQQYHDAYERLEITRKFGKPHDQIANLGMILQAPFTVLVVLAAVLGSILTPYALVTLVLLPLVHTRDAASILFKKKDLAVALALPLVFTLRNFIWIYAAAVWGVGWALRARCKDGGQPMKILLYAPGIILDGEDGSATHVRELADNLSKIGNEVALITTITTLKNRVINSNVKVKPIKHIKVRVVDVFFSLICGLVLGMFTIIRWKPDLIYKRDTLLSSGYLLAKLSRCPNITEANGFLPDDIALLRAKDSLVKLSAYISVWMERRSKRYSDHIVAVTPKLKGLLHTEYGIGLDKITVIANGANTDLFKPLESQYAREQLQLSNDHRYICFTGTLEPWQGVENAIRSMPLILEVYPDVRLLILGEGVMKKELVMLTDRIGMADAVIFTGHVSYWKVPLYINASDVCVAPYIRERNERGVGSSLKLGEYLACGKPVVVSDIEGVSDLLRMVNAGIAVEPDNPQQLAQATVKLLYDQELGKQLGENGRKYMVENQSWESVAKRVAAVCEEVVKEWRTQKGRGQIAGF